MTSGFVLYEFNLDLSPTGLLVCLGLVVVVIVLDCAVVGVGVCDELFLGGGVVMAGTLVGHGGRVDGLGHVVVGCPGGGEGTRGARRGVGG